METVSGTVLDEMLIFRILKLSSIANYSKHMKIVRHQCHQGNLSDENCACRRQNLRFLESFRKNI
jgi:hypothetical protein